MLCGAIGFNNEDRDTNTFDTVLLTKTYQIHTSHSIFSLLFLSMTFIYLTGKDNARYKYSH